MDESKPSIPPSEFRFRSASERTSADIDPATAELAKSDELVAIERQSRSGQIEACRNNSSDGPSVTVYYRNEEEVAEGFLIALSAMGIAGVEQLPEPAKPPVRGAKPKTRYLLPFCVFFLFGCGPTASRSPTDVITFDTAKLLDDFDLAASGDGGPSKWLVIDNYAGRGLAPIDPDPNESRLAFALYPPLWTGRLRVNPLHDDFRQDRSGGRPNRPV
jgi:hypothetical protein